MNPQEDDRIVISEKAANLSIAGGSALGVLGIIICRSGADTIWLLFGAICIMVAPILLVLGVAARPNADVRMGDWLARGVMKFVSMALGSLLLTVCLADLNPFDIAKIKIIHIFLGLLGVFLIMLGLVGLSLLSQPLSFVGLDPEKVGDWFFVRLLPIASGSVFLIGCLADLDPFDIAKIKIIHIFLGLFGVFLIMLGLVGSSLLSQAFRFVGLDLAKVDDWLLRIFCLSISFFLVVRLVSHGQFITLLKNDPLTLVKLVTVAVVSLSVGVRMGYWVKMLRGFNKTK